MTTTPSKSTTEITRKDEQNPYATEKGLDMLNLSWDASGLATSLQVVYEYAVFRARSNIKWYDNNKGYKRGTARTLRMIAIVATGIGGIWPVLVSLIHDMGGPNISATWATVFIGLGAGAIAFDQLFGFSTSWMRSITTGMELRNKLEAFEFAWEIEKVKLEGKPLDFQQAQTFVKKADDFVAEVADVVWKETNEWITEFQNSLSAVNRKLAEEGQKTTRGAMRLVVENGVQSEGGWCLFLDGREIDIYKNTQTAAIADLMPKMYQVRITGKIQGEAVQNEGVYDIVAGKVTEIGLSLPVKQG